jgi:hypothetical protein
MAILKTYPLKNNYYGPDRLVISDMQPDDQGIVHGTTKSLTLSNLKSFIGGSAATLQLTTNFTSGAAIFDANTNTLNIPNYSIVAGDGLNLTGTTLSTELKANGGLVISSGAVTLDLSASAITGTLSAADGGTGATSVGTYDVLVGRNNAWVGSSNFDGAIQLPAGTTAQRPSSAVAGMIRYNSTNALVEIYVDGLWKAIATV